METMLHGLLNFALRSPQRDRSNTKQGDYDTAKSHNSGFIITYCVEGSTWIRWSWKSPFDWEPGRICPYTTLESPQPHRIHFHLSIVRPLDEFQGPSQFHGHGPWPSCKVALSNYPQKKNCTKSDKRVLTHTLSVYYHTWLLTQVHAY